MMFNIRRCRQGARGVTWEPAVVIVKAVCTSSAREVDGVNSRLAACTTRHRGKEILKQIRACIPCQRTICQHEIVSAFHVRKSG